MKRDLLLLLLIAVAPPVALAQASPLTSDHSTEVAVGYNYVHSNAPPAQCGCFALNGGSISIARPLGSGHIAGVFDAGVSHASQISSGGYDLTLSSYTAGARYRPLLRARWNPFGQILIGVAHASGSLVRGETPAATNPALTFASVVGGGVVYRLHGPWSLQAEGDYLLTRYSNRTNDHQNNLRVAGGIAFRFGQR